MPITCLSEEHIAEYIGKSLSAKKENQILEHLKSCEDCRLAIEASELLVFDPELENYDTIDMTEASRIAKSFDPDLIINKNKEIDISHNLKKAFDSFKSKLIQWVETIDYSIMPKELALQPTRNSSSFFCIRTQQQFNQIMTQLYLQKERNDKFTMFASIPMIEDNKKSRLTLMRNDQVVASHLLHSEEQRIGTLSYGKYSFELDKQSRDFEITEKGLYAQ